MRNVEVLTTNSNGQSEQVHDVSYDYFGSRMSICISNRVTIFSRLHDLQEHLYPFAAPKWTPTSAEVRFASDDAVDEDIDFRSELRRKPPQEDQEDWDLTGYYRLPQTAHVKANRSATSCTVKGGVEQHDVVSAPSSSGGNEWELEYILEGGHDGPIWKADWAPPEYSPLLATCSEDRTVAIWMACISDDEIRWTNRCKLRDAKKSVTDVKFSPRQYGLKLASCSEDGTVRIYEVHDYAEFRTWTLEAQFTVSSFRLTTPSSQPPLPSSSDSFVPSTVSPRSSFWQNDCVFSPSSPFQAASMPHRSNARPTDSVLSHVVCGSRGCVALDWLEGRDDVLLIAVMSGLGDLQLWARPHSGCYPKWRLLQQSTSPAHAGGGKDVAWSPNFTRPYDLLCTCGESPAVVLWKWQLSETDVENLRTHRSPPQPSSVCSSPWLSASISSLEENVSDQQQSWTSTVITEDLELCRAEERKEQASGLRSTDKSRTAGGLNTIELNSRVSDKVENDCDANKPSGSSGNSNDGACEDECRRGSSNLKGDEGAITYCNPRDQILSEQKLKGGKLEENSGMPLGEPAPNDRVQFRLPSLTESLGFSAASPTLQHADGALARSVASSISPPRSPRVHRVASSPVLYRKSLRPQSPLTNVHTVMSHSVSLPPQSPPPTAPLSTPYPSAVFPSAAASIDYPMRSPSSGSQSPKPFFRSPSTSRFFSHHHHHQTRKHSLLFSKKNGASSSVSGSTRSPRPLPSNSVDGTGGLSLSASHSSLVRPPTDATDSLTSSPPFAQSRSLFLRYGLISYTTGERRLHRRKRQEKGYQGGGSGEGGSGAPTRLHNSAACKSSADSISSNRTVKTCRANSGNVLNTCRSRWEDLGGEGPDSSSGPTWTETDSNAGRSIEPVCGYGTLTRLQVLDITPGPSWRVSWSLTGTMVAAIAEDKISVWEQTMAHNWKSRPCISL